MKNILVPTDFSVNAGYAVNYAGEFASYVNASITLVHVYNLPVLTDAAVITPDMIETWQKDNDEALKLISDRLLKKHPDLKIETATILGFANDEILALYAKHEYDLIIMGSKGTGNMGDNLFGNVTTYIVRNAKKQVLVIPSGFTYKPIERITLACHNDQLMTDKVVESITGFINTFHAKMYILDVVRQAGEPLSVPYEETNKIKSHFEELAPSVNIIEDENVVHGINDFNEDNSIDVVIMIPQKHSFFERLFTEIHSRHMAKATHKPMLALPNN